MSFQDAPFGRPHIDEDRVAVYHGDSLEVLRGLPDASVDAVVTDPPYELGFMGKGWDASGIAYRVDLWSEALRVLKPGGHMLAFGGTRTWHRLASAIEDAGFEVRDSIAWLYGSGFPKSLDVSKAIDKRRDDRADILRVTSEIAQLRDLAGLTNRDLDDAFGFAGMAGHWTSTKSQPSVPLVEQWAILRDMLNPDPWLDDEVWRLNGRKGTPGEAWDQREVIGQRGVPVGHAFAGETYGGDSSSQVVDLTAPATDAAREWQGWGTALKPAHEPIVVARKPLVGTVAANVLEHGTGALNIDGCRIAIDDSERETQQRSREAWAKSRREGRTGNPGQGNSLAAAVTGDSRTGLEPVVVPPGRWPANVVLDEEQAAELDRQSGYQKDGVAVNRNRTTETEQKGWIGKTVSGVGRPDVTYGAGGGASRFFYVAKAPAKERPKVDGVAHPTVKPLTLMRWLCRLVTPPNGLILEPFAGSGTTIEAALLEGFRVIAIEREADYLPLIQARLDRVKEGDDGQLTFDTPA